MCVVEGESYNRTLERGTNSSKKPTLKDTYPLLAVRCCKKECFTQISHERRRDIYEKYWEMDYDSQRLWLSGKIILLVTKRRRKSTDKENTRRKCSRSYTLPKNNANNITVCKEYFLSSLGYRSDKVLTYLYSNNSPSKIAPQKDRRGKHTPAHKTLDDTKLIIKSHIESFHPAIPHYRRAHEALRRYLPPELNLKLMYDNFIETNPTVKCKERTYRRILNEMNVSFAKLGEEDCEDCREFSLHVHSNKDTDVEGRTEEKEISNSYTPPADMISQVDSWAERLLTESQICLNDGCDICTRWKKHATHAKISREEYRRDVNRNKSENTIYFASDMEVIMLPRLPGLKKVIFTRRVILFHESFAPLGGSKDDKRNPIGVIWHEGIAGRNDEDLASTYSEVINHTDYRDHEHFVFWADNCSAQNKNWTLFRALLYQVNQRSNSCQSVTMKYFEKGHTFMAADSFHKAVEDGMRQKKFMYDFHDFQSIIDSKGKSHVMHHNNFTQFTKEVSKCSDTNYPKIENIREVKFKRGSTKMFWKTELRDTEWCSGEFAKKKYRIAVLKQDDFIPRKSAPRGINTHKLRGIVEKIGPLIPTNRMKFWLDCLENDDVADLAANIR